jgi:hypothetical protein
MKVYLYFPFSRWVESPAVPSRGDIFPKDGDLYEVIEVRWEIQDHQHGVDASLEPEIHFKQLVL